MLCFVCICRRVCACLSLGAEPLLYVNEQPFVLRDGDNPYVNIEHTGINTRRLEAMERQLRRDILTESERLRLQEQRLDEATEETTSQAWAARRSA